MPSTIAGWRFSGAIDQPGCAGAWQAAETLAIDRCHGSAYTLDGTYRRGPSTRDLDHFAVTIGSARRRAGRSTLDLPGEAAR